MAPPKIIIDALRALAASLSGFKQAFADQPDFSALLSSTGWNTGPGFDPAEFPRAVEIFATEIQLLGALDDADDDALAALIPAAVASLLRPRTPDPAWPFPLNTAQFWDGDTTRVAFPLGALNTVVFDLVHDELPIAFAMLRLVGVFEEEWLGAGDGDPASLVHLRTIDWSRLAPALSHPEGIFASVYHWNGVGGDFDHGRLIRAIGALFHPFPVGAVVGSAVPGLRNLYFDPSSTANEDIVQAVVMAYEANVSDASSSAMVKFGLGAIPIPQTGLRSSAPTGFALFPIVVGSGASTLQLSNTASVTLKGALESTPVFAEFRPTGVSWRVTSGTDVSLDAGIRLDWRTETLPWVLVGSANATRIELAQAHIALGAKGSLTDPDITIDTGFDSADLVIDFSESDAFLASIFGTEPQRVNLGVGIAWSSKTGLSISGNKKFEVQLPLHLCLAEMLNIETLYLSLGTGAGKELQFQAAVDASFALGPMQMTAQRFGFSFDFATANSGDGNLGAFQLDVGFKPPNGLGIQIDATAVKGGGFIKLEPEIAQYSGVLQLSIQNTIDIKAIGLLNAKLPNGKPGFSLLLIITGEFPPIQLGMGFTLSGIGGLLGINRTTAIDVLRGGLRNGTLDSILFPPDPLHDVAALLHTVSTVFPVAEGRYVFGPMVRIGWGSPTVLTLDVAVLIELPDPVRIILLGRLKLALPDGKKPVAVIRMDAVGVLDFSRQELSLDASIYDSRLLTFTLSGDMAMRLTWGDHSTFLLSIGGFHPHFPAPAGIRKLGRIAIVLVDFDKDGIVARVRLDAYIALTSNTVQFGARLEAYFKAFGLELQGLLGFDALIHFPFAIEAELAAAVTLSFNGVMLMGADVTLTLTGPQPWHLVGEARFVFLGIKARAPIEIGSGTPADGGTLPPPVDLSLPLLAALQDARNWHPAMPEGSELIASTRPPASGDDSSLLLHPLASLSVRQRLAPLGVALSRFGNAPLQDGSSTFNLTLQLQDAKVAPLQDMFAMAQFQALSDDQKLARPSFEPAAAGLQFDSSAFAFDPQVVFSIPPPSFEDRMTTPARALSGPPAETAIIRHVVPAMTTAADEARRQAYFHSRSAVAQAAIRRQGKGRYAPMSGGEPGNLL